MLYVLKKQELITTVHCAAPCPAYLGLYCTNLRGHKGCVAASVSVQSAEWHGQPDAFVSQTTAEVRHSQHGTSCLGQVQQYVVTLQVTEQIEQFLDFFNLKANLFIFAEAFLSLNKNKNLKYLLNYYIGGWYAYSSM